MSEKITCQVCGEKVHAIQTHIKEAHPDITLAEYQERYPDAPILSETAKRIISEKQAEKRRAAQAADSGVVAKVAAAGVAATTMMKKALHEVFELGAVPAAMNAKGDPIGINVFSRGGAFDDLVPEKDASYIFNINLLRTVLIGLEVNIPTYLWGHAGTGKTTQLEQVCAYTGRPFLRVQHTVNTEEAHIVGQWTVRDGSTHYELGPLAVAMKYGLVYCGDEYDFAMPSVLSVYQPVLEGKALIIKDAPQEMRVVRPHPNFRFVATGNTNGVGDETGLYQGTNIQNAANYERFGIVERVEYMPPEQEEMVLTAKTGIGKGDSTKLVKFANEIRTTYSAGKIGSTVSPRAMINATKLGLMRGSDWRGGIALAVTNRMSRVDKEVCDQVAQRIWG
ncbi:MoxR family ATPase [Inquilinus sp. OTU3971]|uniref:MoxR family ATPase n=1 Tax=Inquilinus sp. OTU3971 TaxID=3043855 RepID=UPI00313D7781